MIMLDKHFYLNTEILTGKIMTDENANFVTFVIESQEYNAEKTENNTYLIKFDLSSLEEGKYNITSKSYYDDRVITENEHFEIISQAKMQDALINGKKNNNLTYALFGVVALFLLILFFCWIFASGDKQK